MEINVAFSEVLVERNLFASRTGRHAMGDRATVPDILLASSRGCGQKKYILTHTKLG